MNVGVIGLGLMGKAMALKLLDAGHAVWVYNRTKAKAEPALERGAQWTDSPGGVAEKCEIVISMVTDPAAVRDIVLGSAGVLDSLPTGSVHCDMSTVSPGSAKQIAGIYRDRGKRFVQAPVSGSVRQIQEGSLLVFAGGAEEDVRHGEEAWKAFSTRTWRLDRPDEASAAKLAINMMIGHMIMGLGQSLLFAEKHEVAPATVLEMLGTSALGCPMYKSKGQSLLARNFAPNFIVSNLLKDLTLAADSAREVGLTQPFNGLTREIFVAAENMGWAGEDYSAAVKVLETLAGAELR